MSGGPDAHRAILRAIEPLLPATARLVDSRAEPWRSATFAGARHRLRLQIDDPVDMARFASLLPDHEFRLTGHIVADAIGRAEGADGGLVVELLTVEAA